MEFKGTKILKWLLEATQPILVLEGSTRSSKSYSCIQYLIIEALRQSGICVRVFRENAVTCSKTIVIDFLEIMRNMGIFERKRWNSTTKRYEFENGSTFYFDGCEFDKLHGLRQDYALLEEVMSIPQYAFNQISTRTTKRILMTYNPSLNKHWVFDSILTREDTQVGYLHSTYHWNGFLTEQQIAAIESYEPTEYNIAHGTANEWQWQVYGLGKRAGREGRIYTNYRETSHWPDRENFSKHGLAIDWGFSKDPCALVEIGLLNKELYVRELIYETGLTVARHQSKPSLPSVVSRLEDLDVDKHTLIIADSASPESIATLQSAGYNVYGVKKGKDSVNLGISLVQGYTLAVDRKSHHILEELANYVWDTHKSSGKQLTKPIDDYNHACDCIRYWCMHHLQHYRDADNNRRRQTVADNNFRYI